MNIRKINYRLNKTELDTQTAIYAGLHLVNKECIQKDRIQY